MVPLNLADATAYVEANIGLFHEARARKIQGLTLKKILTSKNPYLFRAKDIKNVDELIQSILNAFISSGEESMFGAFLEQLAIFICNRVYGGQKAGIAGIDLDFSKNGTRFLVAIKSGPNWGNSQQVDRLIHNFNTAKRTLRTSGGALGEIEFVNGCCYGIDDSPVKQRGYSKLCGQRFWAFISGSDTLYEDLIIPISHSAKEWNEKIRKLYAGTRKRLCDEFVKKSLVSSDGSIDWKKLVQAASKSRK
jgi:Type II restriction endonuclease EcoO109I